ncbi:MAG TPA: LCP family protein [Clostridia bacterium]|nr:LCP family protein [Clostridia bacterium]
MLAHMEFTSKKITLVSIPRDTRVEIPQVGFTKINHAHMIGEIGGGNHSGTEAVLEIVSDFLQCDINYYIKVNFQGFKDIVDTIGGVDIELPAPVKLTFSYVVLDSGNQHIDGDLALKLMKERFSLPDGDFGRQKNHLLLIQSIVSKLLKPRYAKELPLLIQQVKENIIDTNLTVDDILSLAWAFQGMSQENIVHIQIPGHSYYAQDPLVQARVYYWIPDEEKVEEISQKF